MRILLVHNFYQQPGGEDTVFEAEKALLASRGHEVVVFLEDNARLDAMSPWRAAVDAVWSRKAKQRIRRLIEETKPDVAHFHNTFFRISPAAYYACKEAGVPVVQSLHNQRIFCPKATMYRPSKMICTDCVERVFPWPALMHRCYHDSYAQTFAVSVMVAFHQWFKTWSRAVDCYIVFTNFFKEKMAEWGLPREKIYVKPHFIYPDPSPRDSNSCGNYALFVGRLAPEKGVETLIRAWRNLPHVPLKVRGEGQLFSLVEHLIQKFDLDIELVPRLSKVELVSWVKCARFLVWPSEGWYENFGLVAIESFACGVPVIASKSGAMAEIVEDRKTGLLFEPGNSEDLAEKVSWAWSHPSEMAEMGQTARREYEAKYTAERNYEMLMEIYRRAMGKMTA